jgi:hypothetical protein
MAWLVNRPIGLTYSAPGAFEGFTFFCSVRGHHASVLDMQGRIVHQWHHPEGIQHLKLLENGHLLIQTLPTPDSGPLHEIGGSAGAMIELDRDGNTVWEHRDLTQHHDYVRLANGNTVYLAWETIPKEISDQIQGGYHNPEDPEQMWGDVVREIDPAGNLVTEWRSWEHLDFDLDVICPLESHKEWTHANSLEVLENGDWLISFRLTSTVVIVDRSSGDIRWRWGPTNAHPEHDKKFGPPALSHQHNAQMLPNGNVMVFDNGCHRRGGPSWSRIVEIDPATYEFEWTYAGRTILEFYSFMVSGAQRLPNGNTLITEGASGRILEVTMGHVPVWEYISPWTVPSRFGPSPAVFRAYRYAPDDPRLAGYDFSADRHTELNAAIARGEVQEEPDYDHGLDP